MRNAENRLELAERAARAGSEIAAEGFRKEFAVETKSNKTDVVTEFDRRSQRRVIEEIRDEFPDDAIVGEEEDALKEVPEEGDVWVVDPIDGTNNFVRGIPLWTTSVAAVRDGETVAAANVCPALGDVYTADANGAYLNGEENGGQRPNRPRDVHASARRSGGTSTAGTSTPRRSKVS